MFQNWGFLITEMVGLILLAALLGLFVGWVIWGRRSVLSEGYVDVGSIQAELDACRDGRRKKDQEVAELTARLAEAEAAVEQAAASEPGPAAPPVNDAPDDKGLAALEEEGTVAGTRPKALTEAREGGADDLKQIKGIGPKLEDLCHRLGFYHFDQIAAWTEAEVAWVDDNLEGFKGRVTRDDWVSQAKVLASGGTTEFSDRVKDGDVY